MNHSILVVTAASALFYGTPLLYAALGELLAERSGVLNLGVEGMMLVGAVTGFLDRADSIARAGTRLCCWSPCSWRAGRRGDVADPRLPGHQLAREPDRLGLALTIFAGATGLSTYIGNSAKLGGQPAHHEFRALDVLGLADLPVLGPILFHQNALVYASWVLVAFGPGYLFRTRTGLQCGQSGSRLNAPTSWGSTSRGTAMRTPWRAALLAGIGGAYLLASRMTPNWIAGMTSGAGWIAIALVIFAFWRPELTLVGAYLFGLFSSLGFILQARRVHLPPEVFASLPYVMTVVVLVVVSTGWAKQRLGAPAALGTPVRARGALADDDVDVREGIDVHQARVGQAQLRDHASARNESCMNGSSTVTPRRSAAAALSACRAPATSSAGRSLIRPASGSATSATTAPSRTAT